jgi:hypothetical protein
LRLYITSAPFINSNFGPPGKYHIMDRTAFAS